MEIRVLGMGCVNCSKLYATVEQALKTTGIDATVAKVEDMREIVAYGVMKTPALVVDGKVKSAGRIPSLADVTTWITTAADEG